MLKLAVALCVLFSAAEGAARRWEYPEHAWYPGAWRAARTAPAQALFVGTSRVAASINTEVFDRLTSGTARGHRTSLNLGQGYSTIIQHALGLRLLAEEGCLRDVTVFVEAPLGFPDSSRWTDPWVSPEQPQLLLSVLAGRDLPRLWRSHMAIGTKLAMLGRFALKPSRLITYRERIRDGVLARGRETAERLTDMLVPAAWQSVAHTSGRAAGLRAAGDIRTDPRDLDRARQLAVEDGRLAQDRERLVQDWEDTVIADIVRSVQGAGGRVAFFEMPLSTPQAAPLRTQVAKQNREAFVSWAGRRGTPLLHLQRSYSDADFPDLWHLSADRADEFTADVARSWLVLAASSPGEL